MSRLACITLILALLLPVSVGAGPRWRAYNDLSMDAAQTNGTYGNVNMYTTDENPAAWQYVTYGNSGRLLDTNGLSHVETVTITGAQGPTPGQGSSTLNGDAATFFGGVTVDAQGAFTYSEKDLVLAFSNMNPTAYYELVYYANRGYYTTRDIDVTLGGADAFTNRSSAGIVNVAPNNANCWHTNANNTSRGYVFRFTDIQPGTDGQITLTIEDNRSTDNNYPYGSLFMLESDNEEVPEPAAMVQLAAATGLFLLCRRRRRVRG